MDMVHPVTALLLCGPQECRLQVETEVESISLHSYAHALLYSEQMKLYRALSEFTHFMLSLPIMRKKALYCNLVLSALHLGVLGSKKVITIFLLKVIVGLLSKR